ncbi:hypothetical protein SELMODRAFT_72439, partial [Selaginella moellendorffii]
VQLLMSLYSQTSLLTAAANSGHLGDAKRIFDGIGEPDVVCWNAMLSAYARAGCISDARGIFDAMQAKNLMAMIHAPTPACFASVLAACVHRGALELATSYFAAMVRDHGVTPGRQHYGCMVDLMGRAGRVDDARHIVAAMPCHVDALDWR